MENLVDSTLLSWSFFVFSVLSILLGLGVFFVSDFVFRNDKFAERVILWFFVIYFMVTTVSLGLVFAEIK